MVAEFRREIPNISYVNINTGNNISNMSTNESYTTGRANPRSSVRRSIIRNGDNALLSGLLNADPQMRPLIMGGPGQSYEQREHFEEQSQSYQGHVVNQHFNMNEGQSNHSFNGMSSSVSNPITNSFSSPAINTMPRLRVANLPRASSLDTDNFTGAATTRYNIGGIHNNNNNSVHQNLDMRPAEDGSVPYIPNVTTVIRTSSFQCSTNTVVANGYLGPNLAASTMMSPSNFHSLDSSSSSRGPNSRRLQRQLRHKKGTGVAGYSGTTYGHRQSMATSSSSTVDIRDHVPSEDSDDSESMMEMRENQEMLRKENEDLKRKLKVLVNAMNDEEQMSKVMRCLAQQRRS